MNNARLKLLIGALIYGLSMYVMADEPMKNVQETPSGVESSTSAQKRAASLAIANLQKQVKPEYLIRKRVEHHFAGESISVLPVSGELYVIVADNGQHLFFTNQHADFLLKGDVFDVEGGYMLSDAVQERIDSSRRLALIKSHTVHSDFFEVANVDTSPSISLKSQQGVINHSRSEMSDQYASMPPSKPAMDTPTLKVKSVGTALNPPVALPTTPSNISSEATIAEIASIPASTLSVNQPDFRKRCIAISIANAADMRSLYEAFGSMNDEARKECGYIAGSWFLPNISTEKLTVYKAENEKDVLTVLSDSSCGYCKKLHDDIPELNALGYTVRLVPYGRYPYYNRNEQRRGFEFYTPVAKSLVQTGCQIDNESRKQLFDSIIKSRTGYINELVSLPAPDQQCVTQMEFWKNIGNVVSSAATPYMVSTNKRVYFDGYYSPKEVDRMASL